MSAMLERERLGARDRSHRERIATRMGRNRVAGSVRFSA